MEEASGAVRCVNTEPSVRFFSREGCAAFFVFLCFFLSSPICGGRECGRVWGERAGVAKWSMRRRQRDPSGSPRGSRRREPARPRRDETRRDAALKQQENENMDFVCVCACMCVYTFLHRRGCRAGPRPEAAPSKYE